MKKIFFFSLTVFLLSCGITEPTIPSLDKTNMTVTIPINSGHIIENYNIITSHSGVKIRTSNSLLTSSELDKDSLCPNLQMGFKDLNQARLLILHEHADFSIFETLCDNEVEKNFTATLGYASGSIHSIIYYDKKNNSIKTLPIFGSIGNQLQKTIVGSNYELYLLGISEKSISQKIILDVLQIDKTGDIKKVGEIEPSSVDSEIILFPDGIAYFSKEPGELHLFTFADHKDQLIAKNVVQFVSVYSDGKSKVLNEGWNLFYYGYPEGVGVIIEDDSKFEPQWVDVKFYTYKNGETRNTLTIKRQTELLGGMMESTIGLDSNLIKSYDINTKTVLFFGPNRIE